MWIGPSGQPSGWRSDHACQVKGFRTIPNEKLRTELCLSDEAFANDFRAKVREKRGAVQDLLEARGTNRGGQTKFQRPAPSINRQVSAQITLCMLLDRKVTKPQG